MDLRVNEVKTIAEFLDPPVLGKISVVFLEMTFTD